MLKLEKKYQYYDKIYFHREVLCYTKENRFMELLTISSTSHMILERE